MKKFLLPLLLAATTFVASPAPAVASLADTYNQQQQTQEDKLTKACNFIKANAQYFYGDDVEGEPTSAVIWIYYKADENKLFTFFPTPFTDGRCENKGWEVFKIGESKTSPYQDHNFSGMYKGATWEFNFENGELVLYSTYRYSKGEVEREVMHQRVLPIGSTDFSW